ncbi:phage major tail tube protein [Pseudoalteromonas sp. Of7M-16]|uniref:phage major tail tube protein n=1 Tax=Pseudoalteromonas sp. Of7M-16 TaxID=2917756 RepID=UPI001EF68EEA|nr:phage major tail tube protein [Pseudoalteromonas sp. Of7M-16]MCG7551359.1 phage major tail tube protein [Pseudoalteromonas sp. Of7M-16]
MAAIAWRRNRVLIGFSDYVGRVESGELEMKREMAELKGLGMPGTAKVPNGKFEALVAKIKFNNISPSDWRRIINNDGYINVTFAGECRSLDSTSGLSFDNAATTILRGWCETIPGQGPNDEGKSEFELTINVQFIEMRDVSGTILLIDLASGVVEPKELA